MSTRYALFRVVLYSCLAVAIYVGYNTVYLHPCQRNQTYSITNISPVGVIPHWRVEEILWETEDLFEQASGISRLFQYVESGGDISVNIDIQDTPTDGTLFTKGDHYRGEINIYHYENERDLSLVFAHEFGHALGMSHVHGDQSVLHDELTHNTTYPLQLSAQDVVEFKRVCRKFK